MIRFMRELGIVEVAKDLMEVTAVQLMAAAGDVEEVAPTAKNDDEEEELTGDDGDRGDVDDRPLADDADVDSSDDEKSR